MPVGGRVAGKVGFSNNYYNGISILESILARHFNKLHVHLTENCLLTVSISLFDAFNIWISGRSYVGINEEIMWVSIGMGITIAILISIALCYIAREKCQKRREYYVTA